MKRDEIVEKLNTLNQKIKSGIIGNPAFVQNGAIKIFYDNNKEQNEIISLIGKWNYKKEEKKINELQLQKTKLEAELAATFSNSKQS